MSDTAFVAPLSITACPHTIIGAGALFAALPHIRQLGAKALVVTGKVITETGLTQQVRQALRTAGIESAVFNDLPAEPDDRMVASGVRAYRESGADMVIGLGGGTALDTAKAVAAMSVLSGTVADYAGKAISCKRPPLVLIPTTSGTGSEATRFFVCTDTATHAKLLLSGDALLPDLALIDYTYALTSPPSVTVATGMDALTHAIEAYTSKKANPLADVCCLDAICRIFMSLPLAARDGGNHAARESLAVAAYEAGIGINSSSVTLVHGMSRPIGALFHVPHGISNAMLLVECMRFALDGAYGRFAAIARALGKATSADDDKSAAEAFLRVLEAFTRALAIPTLREYGIDLARFSALKMKMAKDALASGSPSNTRKPVTLADELALYTRLAAL